jgi:hypothetical protein
MTELGQGVVGPPLVHNLCLDVHRHFLRIYHAGVLELASHTFSAADTIRKMRRCERVVRAPVVFKRTHARVRCRIEMRDNFEIE